MVGFESSTPALEGVDAASISRFIDAIDADDAIEPHGLIIQRHGKRIVEGYWRPHQGNMSRLLYSLSKTFTGTALALQLAERRLSLEDRVSQHLPEQFEGASDGLRDLRIRHIASMATGHNRETLAEAREQDPEDIVRGFLRIEPDAPPGTLFAYNQPPVLALATILQRLAGQRLTDYLRPRLLDPLGITDFGWKHLASGIELGYTGVYTNLDAVARLGQLYLDNGAWSGKQLLPEDWVKQASSVQVENPANIEPDWRQGYGFQLWMSQHGYRGDGACGQYMVVLPEQDAVIAMFSCTSNMQRVLDYMWTHLLPAMTGSPIESGEADAALADRLQQLALPTAKDRLGGQPVTPTINGSFYLAQDDNLSHGTIDEIRLRGETMIVREGESELHIPLSVDWTMAADAPIAASAARLPSAHIAIDLAMLATPHRLELTIDPDQGSFKAHWPIMPLFGAGIHRYLAAMRAPGPYLPTPKI